MAKTANGFVFYVYPPKRKKHGNHDRWILQYTIPGEATKYPSFDSEGEATDAAFAIEKAWLERRAKEAKVTGEDAIFRAYANRWHARYSEAKREDTGESYWAPSTAESYRWRKDVACTAPFADLPMRSIQSGDVRGFLLGLLKTYGRYSASAVRSTLFMILDEAHADKIIPENPAAFSGSGRRRLRLRPSTAERASKIKAMTPDELATFLAVDPTVAKVPESHALYFAVMAYTGTRGGEANALQLDDLDSGRLTLRRHIARAKASYVADLTKTHTSRRVRIPADLAGRLERFIVARKAAALKSGKPVAPWIFANRNGRYFDHKQLWTSFKRILKAGGLDKRFTPHSLRHSFATIRLDAGAPIQKVQKDLGHKSIKETVDTYGSWSKDSDAEGAEAFAALIKSATKRA